MTQPDKLFKERFSDYERQAPASAWERIESNLDRPNYKGLWMKVAAGLALLAIAAIAWYATSHESLQNNEDLTKKEVSTQPEKETQYPVVDQQTNSPTETQSLSFEETPALAERSSKESKRIRNESSIKSLNKNPEESNERPTDIEMQDLMVEPLALNPEIVNNENSSAITVVQSNTNSHVIIYTAEEVNERFLKKNSDNATSDEKKPSGIQRLITIAADLKNTEGGFGELREKKNEILALNFKKNNEVKNN
jgi:hypothetical protein